MLEALRSRPLDDVLKHRPAADRQHRLGTIVRVRVHAAAATPRHDDQRIGPRSRHHQLVPEVKPDDAPAFVDDGQLMAAVGLHNLQHHVAPELRGHDQRLALNEGVYGTVQVQTSQQAPAYVSVGDSARQSPPAGDHECNLQRRLVQALHRLAQRRGGRQQRFAPLHGGVRYGLSCPRRRTCRARVGRRRRRYAAHRNDRRDRAPSNREM
jgi:hypothetical protein